LALPLLKIFFNEKTSKGYNHFRIASWADPENGLAGIARREEKMNGEASLVVCPKCGARNRVPLDRRGDRALCGKCRSVLPSFPEYPPRAVEIFDWNFQNEVLSFPGPVLVEFYAPWCGYCQRMAPVIDQLSAEYAGRIKIGKVNVDQSPAMASKYQIRSTPSLYFFKGGQLVDQVLGAVPKGEIERRLAAIL
jgi:thioredoxin 2